MKPFKGKILYWRTNIGFDGSRTNLPILILNVPHDRSTKMVLIFSIISGISSKVPFRPLQQSFWEFLVKF